MDKIAATPEYKDLTKQEKDELWTREKLRQAIAAGLELRKARNVGDPIIDLNNCALDNLKKIPKLNDNTAKQLIQLRHQHAGGIKG